MTPSVAAARAWPRDRAHLAVGAMVLAYTAVYSALDAILFRHYLYTDFDLALFAQAVDGLLRGTVYSSIRGMAWPGDHSSLILFLIAPLYAVARHPLTLLVVQSAAQGLGAVPMFALARRETGHTGLALTCAATYLLQPALGYSNLFEFHPELLATAPLLAAFYYLRCRRPGPTLLWAGVALLCREDVALVVLMMALYALVMSRPGGGRLALALAAAAAASAFLTWGVLRPAFNQGEAEYARVYARWGDSLGAAVLHMVRDPWGVLVHLVSSPGLPRDTLVKQQFHLTLFLPLGLLPLCSPATLALALPVFMEHLLSWRMSQHTILCQYTALQVPFVSAASVIGLKNLLGLIARAGRARGAASGRASRGTAAGPPVTGRVTAILIVWALAASIGCQLWFGPLLSSGSFFITGTRGRHLPTSEERTLTPYRDQMVAGVPPQGAIVASFEYLGRFTRRDSLHSLHHVIGGTYTFSSRPYPPPAGVSALIADLAATNIVGAVTPTSAERLSGLVRSNRLAPVAEAGDLVLFVRDARDPVELMTAGPCPAAQDPVIFERQLAYLGGSLVDTLARAGGIVTLRTCWQRVGPIDRFHQLRFDLVDAAGRSAQVHDHDLGYLIWPPHGWGPDQAMRETYRLVLNDDLRPGDYEVRMSARWRGAGASGASVVTDPPGAAVERGFALGSVRVGPR